MILIGDSNYAYLFPYEWGTTCNHWEGCVDDVKHLIVDGVCNYVVLRFSVKEVTVLVNHFLREKRPYSGKRRANSDSIHSGSLCAFSVTMTILSSSKSI